MYTNVSISNSHIKEIIAKNLTIIDIRDPSEYNKMHIKTSINIPLSLFEYNKASLSKTKPIYLICHFGQASKQLAKTLRSEGYNTYSIQGGMYDLTHSFNNSYY